MAAWLRCFALQLQVWVYLSIMLWGLALGGAATLFQTALIKSVAGQMQGAVDMAQSMLGSAWNIDSGRKLEGILLKSTGMCSWCYGDSLCYWGLMKFSSVMFSALDWP
jgi:hypothetical protein